MADIDFIEFVPERLDVIVQVMVELAEVSSGWITLDPAVDEEFPPPVPTLFGRLVSGRGPAVPRATWVPATIGQRRREPVSVGILHGTGPNAVDRLADKDIQVPARWRVVNDHAKRGLVAWVPIDIAHDEVLAWTIRAAAALTRVPLTGAWRAAIHRP